MHRYDLVVQLGSQIQFTGGQYCLAPHTRMRTEASAIALKTGIARRLIISGGSNFGVRYNDQEILRPSILTFEAFAEADFTRRSEAAAIKDVLVNEFGLPSAHIFAETLSSTREENAVFVKVILNRRPAFTGNEKVAVLTNLYHMSKALLCFHLQGLHFHPLFAENVLAEDDSSWIDRICEYYATSKGGKQYPVDQLRQRLIEGTSLAELMY